MVQSKSKYEIWRQASLSQILADKEKEYVMYAGSDQKTSLVISRLLVLDRHKFIDLKSPTFSLIFDMLMEKRKALFATSEHVNEISKMGMQMPKSENIIADFNEEE